MADNDDGADRQLLPGIWRQILEDVSLGLPSTLPLIFLVRMHCFLPVQWGCTVAYCFDGDALLPNVSVEKNTSGGDDDDDGDVKLTVICMCVCMCGWVCVRMGVCVCMHVWMVMMKRW